MTDNDKKILGVDCCECSNSDNCHWFNQIDAHLFGCVNFEKIIIINPENSPPDWQSISPD